MKSQKEESTRKNMKLFFIITGIGLGHTMREAAIIKEIKSQQPTTEIVIASVASSLITILFIKLVAPIFGFEFDLSGDLIKIVILGSVISETMGGFVTRTVRRIIPG